MYGRVMGMKKRTIKYNKAEFKYWDEMVSDVLSNGVEPSVSFVDGELWISVAGGATFSIQINSDGTWIRA